MSFIPIQFHNVSKKYKNVTALNKISFTVNKGEVYALLGPNGAGKTTTIKIMTGLDQPTNGNCLLFGQPINNSIYHRLGVVFEESNLYQRLSGRENLRFFARIYGINLNQIDFLLKKYGLYTAASRLVKTYSKGMKQRLLICRSLLHKPDLLILDEPTSGLDLNSAEIIRQGINEFKNSGRTVFLTTHYLEEADELSDRIAFISSGEIVAVDRPDIFKKKFGQDYLEIRIKEVPGIKQELHLILTDEDELFFDNNQLFLRLSLEHDQIGKKLDEIKEITVIESIHTKEATIKEVFKRLTE